MPPPTVDLVVNRFGPVQVWTLDRARKLNVPLSRKVGETADMVRPWVSRLLCWRRTCETPSSCLNRLREAPSPLHQSGSNFRRPADKQRSPSPALMRDAQASRLGSPCADDSHSLRVALAFLRDLKLRDLIAAVSGQTSSAVSRYIEVIWGIASINRSAISCSSLRMLSRTGTISLSSRTSAAAIREV